MRILFSSARDDVPLHHFPRCNHALSGNRPEGAFCVSALYWRAFARSPAAPTCGLAILHFQTIRPHFSPILSVLSNTCGLSPRRRFRITQAISRRCGLRWFLCFVTGHRTACPKTGPRSRLSNRKSTAVSQNPHKQRPRRDLPGSLPDTRFQGREAFLERISFRGRHDGKPAPRSVTGK